MPLRVELRNWRGEVVTKLADPAGGTFEAAGDFDRVLFDGDLVGGADGRAPFTLLRYVDALGVTVFNRLQMNDLLQDIEVVVGRQGVTPIERRGFERLRVMAERCLTTSDLYVWFVGD